MQWKQYPYEKTVLLNTVYDVLEQLNYPMKEADSHAGKLCFLCGNEVIEMNLSTLNRDGKESTFVQVNSPDQGLSEALLDEISGLLNHVYEGRRL